MLLSCMTEESLLMCILLQVLQPRAITPFCGNVPAACRSLQAAAADVLQEIKSNIQHHQEQQQQLLHGNDQQ